jgi:hypothetical protein
MTTTGVTILSILVLTTSLMMTAPVLGQPADAAVDGVTSGRFEKILLTSQYYCDGIGAGDINRDGHCDVVAGPYWYAGPAFRAANAFYPAIPLTPKKVPRTVCSRSFTILIPMGGLTFSCWDVCICIQPIGMKIPGAATPCGVSTSRSSVFVVNPRRSLIWTMMGGRNSLVIGKDVGDGSNRIGKHHLMLGGSVASRNLATGWSFIMGPARAILMETDDPIW